MSQNQLLVLLPYHAGDVNQARALLHWIKELSPHLNPHACLLAADAFVPHSTKTELGDLAKSIFGFAETAIINLPPDATGWPKAANGMFRVASHHVAEVFKLPFLWLEPDATPLKPSWLDELAVAYTLCPKRFMGALVTADQPPLPPVHLAGCAVYPANTAELFDKARLCQPESSQAWDMESASYLVPRAMNTPLIQQHWGEPNLPPTFKETKEPGDPVNTCTLSFIRPGACLMHRCKDGTLIDLLRQKMQSAPVSAPSEPAAAPVKRGPGRPRKPQAVMA